MASTTIFAIFTLIAILFIQQSESQVRVPDNPCPEVFQYLKDGNEHYGSVVVDNNGSGQFHLTMNASFATFSYNLNLLVEMGTSYQDIIDCKPVKFRVRFPSQTILPRITDITLNDVSICSGPPEPLIQGGAGVTSAWANLYYNTRLISDCSSTSNEDDINIPKYDNPFPIHWMTEDPIYNTSGFTSTTTSPFPNRLPDLTLIDKTCGISSTDTVSQLSYASTTARQEQFPWLAALMLIIEGEDGEEETSSLACTTTLVSLQHVITTGNCIAPTGTAYNRDELALVCGTYDLTNWRSTGTLRKVQTILIHQQFTHTSTKNDLAILQLDRPVTYEAGRIVPVCLWTGDTDLSGIINTGGTVAGWGATNDQDQYSMTANTIHVPVVSHLECLQGANSAIQKLTSMTTFCGGFRNGTGTCTGDIGSSFVVDREGQWMLRGLVSVSLLKDNLKCDLQSHTIFVDVGKYISWIRTYIPV